MVSSDPGLLNSLNALQIGGASRALVRHMNLTAIPEQTAALRGLNVLFLHDIDSGALSKEQRAALELWVQRRPACGERWLERAEGHAWIG